MTIASAALGALAADVDRELGAILTWWAEKSVDEAHGGFHGEIDAADAPVPGATKGAVLNARILWFMSEAALALGDARARELADRAAGYIEAHFIDPVHGGVYWALDCEGRPLARKKQTYAQAFAIYALCAHYRLTRRGDALAQARRLFKLLETRAREPEHGGYVEALDEAWAPLADMRLSEVDANAPKSMNTHLHVLEAYAALHGADPSVQTRAALRGCIELFLRYVIDRGRGHLRMYFDKDWTPTSKVVSFGHDIEASWLIWEACETLGDVGICERARPVVIALAQTFLEEAVWSDGGAINERTESGHVDATRVWWVQAEALVGLLNAFALSGDEAFFKAFERVWGFVKQHHKDDDRGEWTWRSALDAPLKTRAYKAGFWKGPYHNGRAMLETRARLARLARTA
jgi:cellobiose epimerase